MERQLNSSDELKSEKNKEMTFSAKIHQSSYRDRGEQIPQILTQQQFKVVFLGNSGVGKTAFIQHCCSGFFSYPSRATVGLDFRIKTLLIGTTAVTLQLWDTAGQERYRSITGQYYRKADGILTMYDVTDSASFTAAREWMNTVKEKMRDGTVLMLLGNKLDLAKSRKVSTIDGQKLAQQYQALFHECSAKTGQNIEKVINHLAETMATRHEKQYEDAVLLTENTQEQGCCAYNKK